MLKEKVLFDTDIGSDIDDAVCLAYLLMQPRCQLMGVTTVSGEPVERAKLVSALLNEAGRTDVPVYPGAPKPLLTEVKQPLAPQKSALTRWKHDTQFPEGEYLEFMRDVIVRNPGEVTLLAVGPMTNLGLLFAMDPELAPKLKRIVLMNGSFLHQLPGVSLNEWNSLNDPYATAITYQAAAPVHRSIGLDVTMQVRMPAQQVRDQFTHPLLKLVRDYAEVWFAHTDMMTFHDPLAGVSIFAEDIVSYERGKVEVELASPRLMGVTHFTKDACGPHEIGAKVDAQKFFDHYFGLFQ